MGWRACALSTPQLTAVAFAETYMMRLRSTYIYDSAEPFDPSLLQVDENTLQFEFLQAAREERLTFGFNELPQEVSIMREGSRSGR